MFGRSAAKTVAAENMPKAKTAVRKILVFILNILLILPTVILISAPELTLYRTFANSRDARSANVAILDLL
jgi:hypothetical protein